jgi:hypothetical protein
MHRTTPEPAGAGGRVPHDDHACSQCAAAAATRPRR